MVCSHDTSCEPEMPNIDDQSLKRLSGDPGALADGRASGA